jgi:hypothetical protein
MIYCSPNTLFLFITILLYVYDYSCNATTSPATSVSAAQMKSLLFSYGSNSIAQLKARIENPTIVAVPARAFEWQRIFCLRANPGWGGAAASLVRDGHSFTFGSVVSVTNEELSKLDEFECGYHKEELSVSIRVGDDWQSAVAVAYIADHPLWTGYPSESYLTAIHVHLREQFSEVLPECLEGVDIYGLFRVSDDVDKVLLVDRWTYPGVDHLSLPALCVEVNCRRTEKWVMPKAISEVRRELAAAGIYSLGQLCLWLSESGTIGSSTSPPMKHMDAEACSIFKQLLRID